MNERKNAQVGKEEMNEWVSEKKRPNDPHIEKFDKIRVHLFNWNNEINN